MTSCDYTALLDAFVDGELSEEDAERVRLHLETCEECRAYLDDVLAIRAAFPTLEETEVPEGFAESVLAAIPVTKPSIWKRPAWRRVILPLAACLAVAVGVGSAGKLMGGGASGGSGEVFSRSLPEVEEDAPEDTEPGNSYAVSVYGADEDFHINADRPIPQEYAEQVVDTVTSGDAASQTETTGAAADTGTADAGVGMAAGNDNGVPAEETAAPSAKTAAQRENGGVANGENTAAAVVDSASTQNTVTAAASTQSAGSAASDTNAGAAAASASTQTDMSAGTVDENAAIEEAAPSDAQGASPAPELPPVPTVDEERAVPTEADEAEDAQEGFYPAQPSPVQDTAEPPVDHTENGTAQSNVGGAGAQTEADMAAGLMAAENGESEMEPAAQAYLPPEAAPYLTGYVPSRVERDGSWYYLTAEEYASLCALLESAGLQADRSAPAEDAAVAVFVPVAET